MLAVLAFNLMGDALRDLLDPRLRGSDEEEMVKRVSAAVCRMQGTPPRRRGSGNARGAEWLAVSSACDGKQDPDQRGQALEARM